METVNVKLRNWGLLITRFVLIGLLLINYINITAQPVCGKVTNASDNSPLPGVTIVIKGTTTGVVTDLNGKYCIELAGKKQILVFCFIGYVSVEKLVKPGDTIVIKLTEDVKHLDEVVVVGYGVEKRSFATGAVSGISFKSKKGRKKAATMDVLSECVMMDAATSIVNRGGMIRHIGPAVAPGILTAGEINDFTKWNLWTDIDTTDLKEWQSYWQIRPLQRYTVQVTSRDNLPIIDAKVILKKKNVPNQWYSRTDNTGKAELWACAFDTLISSNNTYSIEIHFNDKTYTLQNAKIFSEGVNILKIPVESVIPNQLDAVFVVDATGSMGDEIEYLKTELNDVINQVQEKQKGLSIRLGSIFYRDHGDEYITRKSELTENISQTVEFIKEQSAAGGGDEPEAIEEALDMAINQMNWNETARTRLLFLVLDAPPHYNNSIIKKLQSIVLRASEKGIKIVPITGSGIDKSTEYLMRAMALATNGTYTFLTDHSGVGDTHIKPTTDKYDVEFLNQLLVRLFYNYSEVPSKNLLNNNVLKGESDTTEVINTQFPVTIDDSIQNNLTVTSKQSGKKQTDIPENTLQSWKFYPNPTNGTVTIEMTGSANYFYLADISGKILQRLNIQEREKISLDIGQYPNGIYFIQYQIEEKWLTGKLILKH